ncbi:hypothetical protein H257_09084 [Aphanomyces astaci]|uniref:Uncharacterized protein n=1 Tax=Aphanomyces astaci TaxID=112090 RepID=W4GBY8_APHAT|nr:hypothetical protein H257_09084 [Aphanomyces astaci]ETV77197.1 hypothetical protein H257_09084 [Aphanomyces astaci]|eukprot:XP_009833503.1 hypothetical protein H257_09084 [Aphanomyces astaci]
MDYQAQYTLQIDGPGQRGCFRSSANRTRTYKVLLNDCKSIRLHQAEATALLAGAPPLPPLTLNAHAQLDPELTEWLADNRSTDEVIAKSIRNHVDELIKLEKTAITR